MRGRSRRSAVPRTASPPRSESSGPDGGRSPRSNISPSFHELRGKIPCVYAFSFREIGPWVFLGATGRRAPVFKQRAVFHSRSPVGRRPARPQARRGSRNLRNRGPMKVGISVSRFTRRPRGELVFRYLKHLRRSHRMMMQTCCAKQPRQFGSVRASSGQFRSALVASCRYALVHARTRWAVHTNVMLYPVQIVSRNVAALLCSPTRPAALTPTDEAQQFQRPVSAKIIFTCRLLLSQGCESPTADVLI